MEINKLYEGQVFKNYKVLCKEFLKVIPSGGKSKEYHFKELSRYCLYHKEKQKIVIDEVFQEPIAKVERRGNKSGMESNCWKDYEQLKISREKLNDIGIYYIIKDNDIYIGSTTWGFRNRFQQHYYGYDYLMQHTYDMLQNNGEFHILYDMTGIEDEILIRQVEDEYLQYFKNNTNYNVINKKEKAYSVTEKIKLKNKIIKVREDKYKQAIQLLIDNGLLDLEEDTTSTTNNYNILNGVLEKFDTKNIPF